MPEHANLTSGAKREKGGPSRHDQLRAPEVNNAPVLQRVGPKTTCMVMQRGPDLGKQPKLTLGARAPTDIPTLMSNPKGHEREQEAGPNLKVPMIWLKD